VLGYGKCPTIRCAIDTAAALSTGNLHFFAAFAKAYPHTVAAIHSHTNYTPITLSGIIQQGGASVMTHLIVGFNFHLPYLTREGHPTTLGIATDPNVTVNTILGLPFIQQTCIVIDAADNVANLCTLDTPLFSINYCQAMCTVPAIDGAPDNHSALGWYANIIKEVNNLVAFYSKTPPQAIILLPAKQSHHVDFNDSSAALAVGDKLSTATIGSVIKPNVSYNMDLFSLLDLPCSA
jgi:hypothetical protein